jgi:hypothetical protein
MTKRDKDLAELTKTCKEILTVSKKYSYLWDDDKIWREEKKIYIASGFIAQDESFNIYVTKRNNKLVFGGRNFCDIPGGYNAKKAALEIKSHANTYGIIPAEDLREQFYCELEKPLGNYLAKKALEKII